MDDEKLDGLYFDFAYDVLSELCFKFNTEFNYYFSDKSLIRTGGLTSETSNSISDYLEKSENIFFQETYVKELLNGREILTFDLKKLAENLQEFTKDTLENLLDFLEGEGIFVSPDTPLRTIETRFCSATEIDRVVKKSYFFRNPDNKSFYGIQYDEGGAGNWQFRFDLLEIAKSGILSLAESQALSCVTFFDRISCSVTSELVEMSCLAKGI